MGYVVVSVTLIDGREFNQAVIKSGYLVRVRGFKEIPFVESEVADIRQTDEKWDWSEKP